ncbi:hypothetical protein SLNHY_3309 [Streptomyces albus]|nr:hypothetical protein SLNHY_3309 [Streptomyces albus]
MVDAGRPAAVILTSAGRAPRGRGTRTTGTDGQRRGGTKQEEEEGGGKGKDVQADGGGGLDVRLEGPFVEEGARLGDIHSDVVEVLLTFLQLASSQG